MMRKGWMEDELALSFERPDEGILLEKFEEYACPHKDSIGAPVLIQAARLALKGNVYTVMENEAHRHLKEEAERHVIESLCETLKKKILRPGFGRKPVMGINPGTKELASSLALVDPDGKLLLHLDFKFEDLTDALKQEFLQSLQNLKIEAIAVAHGPGAKEVREGFNALLESGGMKLPIITVHEHSANIFASSPAAKEEFPDLDLNKRRAVFVARFLQNPLMVFLKLDPKFFSLGEFQHDVNQGKLRHALTRAMDYCVNFVGPDANYTPAFVLTHVAGLNADLAKAIVQWREAHGAFTSREDLKKVPGFEPIFEYASGFLRVEKGETLDNTFVHPKFYTPVKAYLDSIGGIANFTGEKIDALLKDEKIVASIDPTNLESVQYELGHLGEDPRGEFEIFEYDPNLKSIADLKKETYYRGIVTNVTSFGTFVDIGIEQDGLVHLSELGNNVAKNPFDNLFPGDIVTVWVTNVNEEKKQISFTMKNPSARSPRGDRRPPRRTDRAPRRSPPRGRPEGANMQAGGAPGSHMDGQPQQRGERTFNDRNGGAGGTAEDGQRRFERRHGGKPFDRLKGKEGEGPAKPKRDDRKPKKPQRDPKTGAVVKLDEEDGRVKGGPRMPT